MAAPRATAAAVAAALAGARQVVADYLTLTKPKVQSLLLLTTVASMEIAGDPSRVAGRRHVHRAATCRRAAPARSTTGSTATSTRR